MRESAKEALLSVAASLAELVRAATAPDGEPAKRDRPPPGAPDPSWERGIRVLLLALFVLGSVNLAPYLIEAVSGRPGPMLYLRSALLVAAAAMFLTRRLRGKPYFLVFTALSYAFACAAFAIGGPYGEGFVWMLAFPLIAGLLLGPNAGFVGLGAAFAALLVMLGLSDAGRLSWAPPAGPSFPLLMAGAALDILVLSAMAMSSRRSAHALKAAESARGKLSALEAELAAANAALRRKEEELRRSNEAMALEKARYQALLGHDDAMVLCLDAAGRVREAGPSSLPLLGYEPAELYGRDFFELVAEEERGDQRAMFSSSLVSGLPTFSAGLTMLRKDGMALPVELRGSNYLHNPILAGVLVSARDLSRQRSAEAKAEYYQRYDQLTGLLNRESFMRETERAVLIARNRGRVLGVMVIGLDRFKRVNDLYGTEVGDRVLKEAAEAVRASFRNDDVVARYRGDKFVAMFPDIRSKEHIKEIIAKAESAFEQPLRMELGEELKLSASFGVALFPNDAATAEDLVRNAETALYMAKEAGRDRYRLFDAELNGQLLERQKIEADLYKAIRQKTLEPFFQPKVDREGMVVGAEALVRWRHPSGELKNPAYFIDVAEKSGSIDSIGELMLRMSCEMAASWRRAGLTQPPVSINLSPRQFGREDLVGRIKAAIDESGVDPTLLEFEITESGIMENESEGIRKLRLIKELGAAISIDDFGTGYSSFAKLKDYPIDTVKIDRSFVAPLPWDRKAGVIAAAIVDLAHTLSFSVVAEGVERLEQLEFLESISCDSFQGFLFSEAVPEPEFKEMLRRREPLYRR